MSSGDQSASEEPQKPPSDNNPSTATALIGPDEVVRAKIQPAIQDLPTEKQREIRHVIDETFTGIFASLTGPKIDAETARILADSQDREGQRRFEYLQARQQNEAKEKERAHELERERHEHTYKLLWPIVIVSLLSR